jgi:hypothetical protein
MIQFCVQLPLTPCSWLILDKPADAQSHKKFSALNERGCSLPSSQEPTTSFYPGTDAYNPHTPFYRFNSHFNIIFPFMDMSSLLRFSYQIRICNHHISHVVYWWGVQIMKLLIMQFLSSLLSFHHPRWEHSPQHPVLKHSQSLFFPRCGRQVSNP